MVDVFIFGSKKPLLLCTTLTSTRIVPAHRSFSSEGMCLNQGNGLYKLQFESGQFKFNHCYFLFPPLPPPSQGAVETQLVCHRLSYVFWPKIAHPVLLPSTFGCRCRFSQVKAHLKVWSGYKNMEGDGLKKHNLPSSTQPRCLSKGTFLMDDPLFVCGGVVGRKPLSHFHRGLLCTHSNKP